MAVAQDLRRRLKSIRSTRQVTRAMQLVAAVKMRAAQRQALASRTYARWSWALLQHLAKRLPAELHPLLQARPQVKREVVVVISANRGLAGSFHAQLVEHAAAYCRERQAAGVPVAVVILGKRARVIATRYGFPVVAEYERLDAYTEVVQTLPVTRWAVEEFLSGRSDQVSLIYTEFFTTLKQTPTTVTLLPAQLAALKAAAERLVGPLDDAAAPTANLDFLFEPSPLVVLDQLLPRFLEMQVYQAALESTASEHSARMVAMKNATDAAGELIDDLTLSYNQLRQAAITKELAEISAGRLALSA